MRCWPPGAAPGRPTLFTNEAMMKSTPVISAVTLLCILVASARAADPAVSRPQTSLEKKALDYLVAVQDKDGAWMPEAGPAVTAMVVRGLVQAGRPLDDPAVKRGLDFIEKFRQPDGGFYKDSRPNYNTSIVLGLLAVLPHETYRDQIDKAQAFLRGIQSVEGKTDNQGKPITKDHPWYGGAGYAGAGARRPDLSNTSFFLDGLVDSGAKPNDPAIQNALIFVSRCQMNSETNDQPFARGQRNGGFVYSTANGGESMMGKTREREGEEVLVAYGSMTYAGLKSFIYAGLTRDDPRVKLAWKWIRENWTLDVNPGTTKAEGLYYYYHTFAKTLRVAGVDTVADAKGIKHDWRQELTARLASLQKEDGRFINEKADRWMEGNPALATSYIVLTLQEARK